jgi:hypothetical protein
MKKNIGVWLDTEKPTSLQLKMAIAELKQLNQKLKPECALKEKQKLIPVWEISL